MEYLVVFFALVAVFAGAGSPGGPIPLLVLAAGLALAYLRRQPEFDRRDLFRPAGLRRDLARILAGWAGGCVLAVGAVAALTPTRLFDLPIRSPLLWGAIVVLYPLCSVYPQELLFRAFLLHRYAPVFGTGRGAALASAAAFGFAHLIFANLFAIVTTVVGGWLFARRYQRTRSLLAVSVEHALYGILVFTVGLGHLFYRGVAGGSDLVR